MIPTRGSSPDETAGEPLFRLAQCDVRWQPHRAARERDVEALIARDGPAIREGGAGLLDIGCRIGFTAGFRAASQPDEFWRNNKCGQDRWTGNRHAFE